MKYVLVVLMLLPLFSFAQKIDQNYFIGKWVAEAKGEGKIEVGFITFTEDGFAFMELDGQILGGKEFITLKEEKASLTYEVNTDAEPIKIDFILTVLSTQEQRSLSCIAKPIDDNTMWFTVNSEEIEITDFTDKNSIVLTRV